MQPSSQSDSGSSVGAAETTKAEDDGVAAALGRIPSGLFVVTWRVGEQDRAMLASWVMQAGFAPAQVSIAVAPSRDLLATLQSGAPCVINVLADAQRPLVGRFGKPAVAGEDPFSGLEVRRTPRGLAALAEAAAWLECDLVSRADHGDHVVVVARVSAAGGSTDRQPLVHLRRNGLRY
jgi:flavin reductase (DIM6/NTAB) family NADH-FMN oxidoreductase RutF